MRNGLHPQYCCVMVRHGNIQVTVLNGAPNRVVSDTLYEGDHYIEAAEHREEHFISPVNNITSHFNAVSTAPSQNTHLTLFCTHFRNQIVATIDILNLKFYFKTYIIFTLNVPFVLPGCGHEPAFCSVGTECSYIGVKQAYLALCRDISHASAYFHYPLLLRQAVGLHILTSR